MIDGRLRTYLFGDKGFQLALERREADGLQVLDLANHEYGRVTGVGLGPGGRVVEGGHGAGKGLQVSDSAKPRPD